MPAPDVADAAIMGVTEQRLYGNTKFSRSNLRGHQRRYPPAWATVALIRHQIRSIRQHNNSPQAEREARAAAVSDRDVLLRSV
jgi:hypothetical protein